MIMASERELIRKAIRNKRSSLSMLKHNLGNDDRNDAKIALKQAELKALDAYDEWGSEMDLITIAAVRYAVGRATYMTEEVASFVWKNIDRFIKKTLCTVADEIETAAAANNLGMSMDKEIWLKLLKLLKYKIENPEKDLNPMRIRAIPTMLD